MKHRSTIKAAAALAVAALAFPAGAAAHGSVFTVTAKTVVPNSNPIQLADQTQYAVTNHGYTMVLRESNGITNLGMINFKVLPSAYRATIPKSQWFTEGGTGAQPHATCRGVAALDSETTILAWQGADPFYAYIPFQKTAAGLQDETEVATWISIVKAQTGVDLAVAPDPASACASLGGTYYPADTVVTTAVAMNSGVIADATTPLSAQIATLTTSRNAADAAKATADAAAAAATTAKTAAEARAAAAEARATAAEADAAAARAKLLFAPLKVALDATTFPRTTLNTDGIAIKVTGPALQPVRVHLHISVNRAKALHLNTTLLGRGTANIGADGTATVVVKPSALVAKAISNLTGNLPFRVDATWGGATSVAGALVG